MKTEELIGIGFTKAQAEVYLQLLNYPESTAGQIAKRLGIDRSFIYGVLQSLNRKGLVCYSIKQKKRVFVLSDPTHLLEDIEEKKKKIYMLVEEIKSIHKNNVDDVPLRVYEGKEGLKAFINDFLHSTKVSILGGGGKLLFLETIRYEYPHYVKEIAKKKIKGRLITSKNNKKIMKEIYKHAGVEIRSLDNLSYNTSVTIIPNKIAFYSGEKNPKIIVIDDHDIVQTMQTYFNHLWKIAK